MTDHYDRDSPEFSAWKNTPGDVRLELQRMALAIDNAFGDRPEIDALPVDIRTLTFLQNHAIQLLRLSLQPVVPPAVRSKGGHD